MGTIDPRACNRMSGRVRQGELQAGEEGNNLMWLLDFKLDFFNDEAKEKGEWKFCWLLSLGNLGMQIQWGRPIQNLMKRLDLIKLWDD